MTSSISRTAFVLAMALGSAAPLAARAESVLTVAMTAGDIPATTGNPDQGFEGFRFVGYNLYDGLALWDLSRSDKPSDIKPGLATVVGGRSQQPPALDLQAAPGREVARRLPVHRRRRAVELRAASPTRRRRSIFTQQMALSRTYVTNFESAEKIDDNTVAITTKVVESLFPYSDVLLADGQPLPRRGAALRLDRLCRASLRHRPVPLRPAWSRMSAWSCCRTKTTGTRSASPNMTGWCCCRCRRPRLAPPR